MHRSRFVLGLGWLAMDDAPGGPEPSGTAALACLAAARDGHEARVIGRVGQDRAGDELAATLREAGIDIAALQRDPDLPTPRRRVRADGTVSERVDELESAPDRLQWDYDLEDAARWADVVVFGLESWRSGQARSEELRLLDEAETAVRAADLTARTPSRRPDGAIPRNRLELALERADIATVDAAALSVLRVQRLDENGESSIISAAQDTARAARIPLLVVVGAGETRSLRLIDGRTDALTPHRVGAPVGEDAVLRSRPEISALLHAAIASLVDDAEAALVHALGGNADVPRTGASPDEAAGSSIASPVRRDPVDDAPRRGVDGDRES